MNDEFKKYLYNHVIPLVQFQFTNNEQVMRIIKIYL